MRSLILGGTKGLGRALAIESLAYDITPIVTGRSVDEAAKDPDLRGAEFRKLDLTDPADVLDGELYKDLGDVDYVFWVAGAFIRKPLTDSSLQEVTDMTELHFVGPVAAISAIHRVMKMARPLADRPGQPYHLVTIASTSSWRMRENETLYCALKAAKAHFTRNFSREMARDLPGSRATLVNPGGLKTPNFWGETGQDIGAFMEPAEVARIIWERAYAQSAPFDEYQIIRNADGTPRVEGGARMPESPF